MTPLHKIYILSNKIAQALLKGKGLEALERSDALSDMAKERYKRNLSEGKINKHINLFDYIDKDADWKNIANSLEPRQRPTMLYPYAVAASLALLIAITYVFIPKRSKSTTSKGVNTEIKMGTSKAILTLNDGSNVALEKGNTYDREDIHSDGEQLIYDSDCVTPSKLKYHYLTIPRGGQFQIRLSDDTKVWLNSDSKLKYPIAFVNGESRRVELLYGEAYFQVSPSSAHNGSAFKVSTGIQEVEVLGTAFNIKAYKEDYHIYTTLVEGKVSVTTKNITQQLSPNQQSILNIEDETMVTAIVDVSYDILWTKGLFSFKDRPLKEIMEVLSRWYDIEVSFKNDSLENVKFNGILNKNQTIEDILTGIKNTKFINAYDINNKTITIK